MRLATRKGSKADEKAINECVLWAANESGISLATPLTLSLNQGASPSPDHHHHLQDLDSILPIEDGPNTENISNSTRNNKSNTPKVKKENA